MITTATADIHDEARRRILDLVGGHRGSDLALKTLLVVIKHTLSPGPQSRHQLHGVLQLVTASNRLEKSLPDDYRDDRHWPLHMAPIPVPGEQAARAPLPDPVLLRRLGELEEVMQRFERVTIEPPPRPLTSVPPPPDLDGAARTALEEIRSAAERRQQAMAIDDGNALIETAARMAVALRTAASIADIERVRATTLAHIDRAA